MQAKVVFIKCVKSESSSSSRQVDRLSLITTETLQSSIIVFLNCAEREVEMCIAHLKGFGHLIVSESAIFLELIDWC